MVAQRTISGTVTDAETGETLIGANILVVGTSTGTITDFDGTYSLEVPADARELQFSYTGYTTQTITIGSSDVIDLQMSAGQVLDEVVVIGYGTVKREDATGSVQTINTDVFNRGAITSAQELIAGKVPGVAITPGSDPGGGATIRIRGGSSLNASNDPLFVIDGVPVENRGVAGSRNVLNLINPNDIENVTVLKDASATAIYGSRASNGVILITTKKGKLGKQIGVSYNGNVAFSNRASEREVLNGDEFRTLVQDNFPNDTDLLGTENTDWQKEIFQTGITQDHNVSLSGGIADVLPYRVSLGYTDRDGILKTDNFQRMTYGVTLTPGFLDNRLQLTANFKGMNTNNQFANRGAIGAAVAFDPTQPVLDPESPYGGYFTFTNNDGTPNTLAPANPLALLELKDDQSTVNRFIGNVQVDYRFSFLPELRANMNIGYDQAQGDGSVFEPGFASFAFDALTGGGTDNTYNEEITNQLFDFYLNYVKDLGTTRLDVMAGYGYQHFKFEKEDNRSDLAGTPDNTVQILTAREYYLVSLFGRLNYTINDRYLLTFTVRRDGTSRFNEDNRYGIFPAAALAYKIIDQNNALGPLSNLKLRVGWGVTGQQDLGDNFYPYIPTYTISLSNAQYQFGDEFIQTYRPGGYNTDLRWEETTTYNIGVDYNLFNDRIFGSIEYYLRQTDDLLTTTRPPAGTNLTNNIPANIGSLENEGIEFSINVVPVQTADAEWSVGFNLTRNVNEITSLTLGDDPNFVGFETGGISGGVGNNIQLNSVGSAINSFYVYEQVYNENGNPVEGLYVDRNGDGRITPDDRYLFEDPAADIFMGFTSNFNYGNFDFSFAGRALVGNYMYDNGLADLANFDRVVASTRYLSNVHRDINVVGFNTPRYFSDYFVRNASFLRMDHITAGYRFDNVFGPDSGSSLRVYATFQNPFVITQYEGFEPEEFSGIDNNVYPRARTILFGVNLNL